MAARNLSLLELCVQDGELRKRRRSGRLSSLHVSTHTVTHADGEEDAESEDDDSEEVWLPFKDARQGLLQWCVPCET